MIEIVRTDPVMLCFYKRLEFTEHLRRGWKGWKMITILSNDSAKRLGKHILTGFCIPLQWQP